MNGEESYRRADLHKLKPEEKLHVLCSGLESETVCAGAAVSVVAAAGSRGDLST